MALDTYANLKTSIEDWSKRNDAVTLIDDFIDIAEQEMWKRLKIRSMEGRSTAPVSTRYLALPSDFIQMRKLSVTSGGKYYEVTHSTPEALDIIEGSGRPTQFTVTTQLEFNRTPDSTYTVEMQYIKKLAALSASNTTNDILTNHPMLYLYGSLWALWTWGRDEEQAEYYFSKFNESVNSANLQYKKGRFGPAPRARSPGLIV